MPPYRISSADAVCEMTKVKVVIVNFNSSSDTIECLSSLLDATYKYFQVFVVDNSPSAEPAACIAKWAEHRFSNTEEGLDKWFTLVAEDSFAAQEYHQKLVLIKANENKGFAAANNIVLRYMLTRPEYAFVWALNNDTFVPADSLEKLVNAFNEQPASVGILGTALLYHHNPDLIQGLGGKFNKWFATAVHLAEGTPAAELHKFADIEIDYPIGASMCVRREFLEDVGLMNEEYFLYFEEMDWVRRGQAKGWQFKTSVEVKVLHKEGASIGTGAPMKRSGLADYYGVKNRLVFARNYHKMQLPTVYFGIGLALVNRIRRGQFAMALNVCKILLAVK